MKKGIKKVNWEGKNEGQVQRLEEICRIERDGGKGRFEEIGKEKRSDCSVLMDLNFFCWFFLFIIVIIVF